MRAYYLLCLVALVAAFVVKPFEELDGWNVWFGLSAVAWLGLSFLFSPESLKGRAGWRRICAGSAYNLAASITALMVRAV